MKQIKIFTFFMFIAISLLGCEMFADLSKSDKTIQERYVDARTLVVAAISTLNQEIDGIKSSLAKGEITKDEAILLIQEPKMELVKVRQAVDALNKADIAIQLNNLKDADAQLKLAESLRGELESYLRKQQLKSLKEKH